VRQIFIEINKLKSSTGSRVSPRYLKVNVDAPMLSEPIHAAIFASEDAIQHKCSGVGAGRKIDPPQPGKILT